MSGQRFGFRNLLGRLLNFVNPILDSVVRHGGVEEDLDIVGEDRKLADDIGRLIVETARRTMGKFLEIVGTVKVPAAGKFAARDHFMVNTSASAEVKISLITDAFKLFFLDRIEEPVGQTELCYRQLREPETDGSILEALKELRNGAETTLSRIWELLKLQPQGKEKGVLLVNHRANIFYIPAVTFLFVVYVIVDAGADDGGWSVDAVPVGHHKWDSGHRVFSTLLFKHPWQESNSPSA